MKYMIVLLVSVEQQKNISAYKITFAQCKIVFEQILQKLEHVCNVKQGFPYSLMGLVEQVSANKIV